MVEVLKLSDQLREIVNMVSKGYTRTSKQISVKGSFYYIFPPILVVFIACGLFSVSGYAPTHTPPGPTFKS